MRADAQTYIKVTLQRDAQPSSGGLHSSVGAQGHVYILSAFHDAQAPGGGESRLNLASDRALLVAKLQRCQPAGMQSNIDINRVGVEALAQNERGFLVLIPRFGQK